MTFYIKEQNKLIKLKNFLGKDFFTIFSCFYFFISISLYFGSDILSNGEYFDLLLEILLCLLSIVYISSLILYNSTFNALSKLVKNKEETSIDFYNYYVYYIKESNFNKYLVSEQEKYWSFNNLFFFLIPIIFVSLGYYNSDFSTDIKKEDIFYGIGLVMLNILLLVFIEDLRKGFEYILHENLVVKEELNKKGIESYILEIKEHLKIFNETSAFRIRVEEAIHSIIEIYLINKSSLERLISDVELSDKIIRKNLLIEKELRKMLFSIIDYNNERNEVILESINNNIKIINSLRN